MQETMTIKEVEEVIKMKLFTFIADYKGGTYRRSLELMDK